VRRFIFPLKREALLFPTRRYIFFLFSFVVEDLEIIHVISFLFVFPPPVQSLSPFSPFKFFPVSPLFYQACFLSFSSLYASPFPCQGDFFLFSRGLSFPHLGRRIVLSPPVLTFPGKNFLFFFIKSGFFFPVNCSFSPEKLSLPDKVSSPGFSVRRYTPLQAPPPFFFPPSPKTALASLTERRPSFPMRFSFYFPLYMSGPSFLSKAKGSLSSPFFSLTPPFFSRDFFFFPSLERNPPPATSSPPLRNQEGSFLSPFFALLCSELCLGGDQTFPLFFFFSFPGRKPSSSFLLPPPPLIIRFCSKRRCLPPFFHGLVLFFSPLEGENFFLLLPAFGPSIFLPYVKGGEHREYETSLGGLFLGFFLGFFFGGFCSFVGFVFFLFPPGHIFVNIRSPVLFFS